jgi:hypothetical protein
MNPRCLEFLDLSIGEFNCKTLCSDHSGSSLRMATSSTGAHSHGILL